MNSGRLFEIIYLLMKEKKTTAKILAEHFEVSERTIYRDVDKLSLSGIPVYCEKGKGGGVFIREDFVLSHALFSEKEQSEIFLALSSLKALHVSDTEKILHKLSAVFHKVEPDWLEVDFAGWGNEQEVRRLFEEIKKAIFAGNILRFDYYNSQGEKSQRKVTPMKLLFKGQAWYLYGYCMEKKDDRIFKLSRIRGLESLPDKGKTKLSTKNRQEISYESPPMIKLWMRFQECMGYRIFDEFMPESIHPQPDGSFLVELFLPKEPWIYDYIQGFGEGGELLEPASMRDELREMYKKLLKKYSSSEEVK